MTAAVTASARTRAAAAALFALLAALVLVPITGSAHPMGPDEHGGTIASGRRVTPTGTQIRVGHFAQAAALSPDERHLAVANTGTEQTISWIDTATNIVQTLVPVHPRQAPPAEFPDVNAVFAGMAFSPDGGRLWISGGARGSIYAFDVTPAGALVQDARATIDTGTNLVARLAVSSDARTLYATDASYRSESLFAIDLATGAVTRRALTGLRPFALATGGDRVWVGAMQTGEVRAFDAALNPVGSVDTGVRPMALTLAGDDLMVAEADTDEVVVLDPSTLIERERISLRVLDGSLGASPNDIAVAGDVAAVTLGGANAVAILDRGESGWALRGLLPAGWTPEAVALDADARTAWAVNARGDASGIGAAGLTNPGPSPVTGQYGTVSAMTIPTDLTGGTAQVRANNTLPPLPAGTVKPPIEHVVFILRENKTFDSLLGDTPGGDPRFVVFPRPNTPSLHAMADRFNVLTDMHANAEASDQGHQWATGGYVTDFTERFTAVFPRDNDCMTALWGCGNDPITYPQSGYLYDALERAGVDWRVYGEWLPLLSRRGAERPEFADNRVAGYPGYKLSIADTTRAQLWTNDFIARGLPAFSFIYLPTDHGLTVEDDANPTLQQQVADNDLATGQIVEAISHSPYWPSTAIFLTEDDPQGYFDHIDAQRTVGVVISPWARGGTLDTHTDTVGIVRTMAWLLGVEPWSAHTAGTPPLAGAFTTTPDFTPFIAPPLGLGIPPGPVALARARAIIDSLPVQTGPDQVAPSIQLEFSSLATKGWSAARFARWLGIDFEPDELDEAYEAEEAEEADD